MNTQKDLVSLVKAFQDVANRHAVERVMAMFADDAEFEMVGLFTLVGKQQIRAIFEYDAGVNTELQFINCTSEGNTVTCQLVECNDRLEATGISKLHHTSCVLTFKDRLIKKFTATLPAESTQTIGEMWQAFLPWIAKNYPADYSRMFTPEGRFIYNRENGERVVPLLKEWRASQGK